MVIPSAAFVWLLGVGSDFLLPSAARRARLREQIMNSATPLEIPWEFSTISKDVVAAAADAQVAATTKREAAAEAKATASASASRDAAAKSAAAGSSKEATSPTAKLTAAPAAKPASPASSKKEAGPAPAGGSSVPPAKTDPAKAA